MPVWHVSVALWSRGQRVQLPDLAERIALRELAGVGGEIEWWHWNPDARVGHLRVAVTDHEHAAMPPGRAFDDAGETGPPRPRTRH